MSRWRNVNNEECEQKLGERRLRKGRKTSWTLMKLQKDMTSREIKLTSYESGDINSSAQFKHVVSKCSYGRELEMFEMISQRNKYRIKCCDKVSNSLIIKSCGCELCSRRRRAQCVKMVWEQGYNRRGKTEFVLDWTVAEEEEDGKKGRETG